MYLCGKWFHLQWGWSRVKRVFQQWHLFPKLIQISQCPIFCLKLSFSIVLMFLKTYMIFLWFLVPISTSHSHCLLLLPSTSIFFSLWHGAFRQTEAMLFEQCLLLDGPSFIFTHGAFPVPEQLYTWLHLELKEQAESLSPAKEQQHCDFCWASCLLCPCLHTQLTKRGYCFVLIKWPVFRQEKLT